MAPKASSTNCRTCAFWQPVVFSFGIGPESSHCTDLQTGKELTYFLECNGSPSKQGPNTWHQPAANGPDKILKPTRLGECKIIISGSKDCRVFTYTPSPDHDWSSVPLVVFLQTEERQKAIRVLKSASRSFSGQWMGTYHDLDYEDLVSDRSKRFPSEELSLTVQVAGANDAYRLRCFCGRRHYQENDMYGFKVERDERERVTVQALTPSGWGNWKVTLSLLSGEHFDIIVKSDATWEAVHKKLEVGKQREADGRITHVSLWDSVAKSVFVTSDGQALLPCQKVSNLGKCALYATQHQGAGSKLLKLVAAAFSCTGASVESDIEQAQ